MKRILFVEDDDQYRKQISDILEGNGYEVTATEDPVIAMDLFQESQYDLVISDYMMGTMNGVQLIKYLKRIDAQIKTIILTGVDSQDVEMLALDISIDQFLRKDVREDVFLRYVKRVIESPVKIFKSNEDGTLKSIRENITIHTNSHEVYKDGQLVDLTFKEYQILVYFLEHMGEVLERDQIMDELWSDTKDEITSRVVDTQVKLVRKKLKLNAIQSIRNVGYRWNE